MSERSYPLAKDGVFWTIQGEGALLGEPMAFVRLAGCSVGCAQCDTDYRVSRRVDVETLVAEIQSVIPSGFSRPWVWITGGEPTDHDLAPLVTVLQAINCNVAIATSGVRRLPVRVEWVSVSPHAPEPKQSNGHELKVVPQLNGLAWSAVEELGRLSFPWKFIQPLAGDAENQQACVAFVREHPGWRLSPQAHKAWGIP